MIIRADILIMSVLHAESSRYGAKLYKAQPFIQMTRMGIGRYHCIELQHAKALCFSLLKAVLYKLLPDMQPSRIPVYRIACIADMSAPSYIVGM